MSYSSYVAQILSDSRLIGLLPNQKVYRLKAASDIKVPYCTYLFYDESGAFYAEGKVIKARYYIQVDINSNTDFTEIENVIRIIAKEQGWKKGAVYEDVDPQTGLLFKCLRFTFDYEEEAL